MLLVYILFLMLRKTNLKKGIPCFLIGGNRRGHSGFHGSFFNFDDLFDDADDSENGQNAFGDFHSFFGDSVDDPLAGRYLFITQNAFYNV